LAGLGCDGAQPENKLLAAGLGVGTVLSLLLAVCRTTNIGRHADINQLTHAAVEEKLEADLEARADSLSKITGALLAPR